jgi:hypothetical protein
MDDFQKKTFELCLAFYRLSEILPKGEILVRQIKELVNEITADIFVMERLGDNLPVNMPASFVERVFDELPFKIIRYSEKLVGYLEIARAQNWVNPANFDALISEYRKIISTISSKPGKLTSQQRKELLKGRSPAAYGIGEDICEPEKGDKASPKNSGVARNKKAILRKELNQRQKKIMDFLKKREEAKMGDLQGIFKGEVTERTLRNDLQYLVGQRLIKAEGEFKTRKYFLK